ncbi:MAG: hypothetical protein IID44_08685 [Planctomycetes bacterium]|nr:hypothetical protein [Planctomycetota bacterium]
MPKAPHYVPTPEEIEERSALIRSSWSERERLIRLGLNSEDTERNGVDSPFDEYDLD